VSGDRGGDGGYLRHTVNEYTADWRRDTTLETKMVLACSMAYWLYTGPAMEDVMLRFIHSTLFTLFVSSSCVVQATSAYAFPSPEKSEEEHIQDVRKDAVGSYNKGVEKQKKAFEHFAKADTSKAVKELERAVKEYEKAVALIDSFPEALSNMGYCLRNLGNYTKALEVYDRALKLKPNFPEAIEYRAVAYLWLGRKDDARLEYDRLLKMDSTQAVALKAAIDAAEAGKLTKGKW
jgi:tetratricopeptide (TPR) repeat protein